MTGYDSADDNGDDEPYKDEQMLRRLYYDEGLSTVDMGERFGCSAETVRRWMDEHDFERSNSYIECPQLDGDVLQRLYWGEGTSAAEIGEQFGCSKRVVLHRMRKHGIDRRSGSEARTQFSKPDEETLRHLYYDERMTVEEIGEKFGCSSNPVLRWCKKYGIELRSRGEWNAYHASKKPATFRMNGQGYERWVSQSDGWSSLSVHRLLAVSEFGFDAVRGMVVHHENNIPWDNRPENIRLMTRSEHNRHHHLGETR